MKRADAIRRIFVSSLLAGVASLGGISMATAQVITGCYNPISGAIRLSTPFLPCQLGETTLTWNQIGPAGLPGPAGATGATGARGARGPGVDYSKVYNKDSANVHLPAGTQGSAFAFCNPGDVAVGGSYGVNGPPPFFVYFAGTENNPAYIGSATNVAGDYIFYVYNTGPSEILIFSTVTCAPPVL